MDVLQNYISPVSDCIGILRKVVLYSINLFIPTFTESMTVQITLKLILRNEFHFEMFLRNGKRRLSFIIMKAFLFLKHEPVKKKRKETTSTSSL